MKGNRGRINVTEALRLMIKQIAAPLQILSGAEVLLRACHAVVSSIRVGAFSASHNETYMHTFKPSSKPTIKQSKFREDFLSSISAVSHCMSILFGTSRNVSVVKNVKYRIFYLF